MTESAAAIEPRILISYRRDDSSGHAGHLFEKLTTAFGSGALFMDIDGIQPGEDFVKEIEKAVTSSHVLIAVIGRSWLDIRDQEGKRRLDDPKDFVRLEIAAALQRNILVIPALVQDAPMPRERDLPIDVRPLARKQAIEISDTRFNQDVERLVEAIRTSGVLPGPAAVPPPAAPATATRRRVSWIVALPAILILAALAVWGASRFSRPRNEPATPVTGPPVVRRFVVEPSRYIAGHVDNVRLSWEVDGAAEVSLAPLGSVDAKGSRTVPAPAQDTSFTLLARNRLGDSNGRVTVDVLNIDEFIAVETSSPDGRPQIKKWLSEYLRSLQEVGYLPGLRGVTIASEPRLQNAYYDERSRRIVIGESLLGDQDVVLREYTHLILATSDTKQSGVDPFFTREGAAIESGLADYLPASSLNDPKIGDISGPILLKQPYIRTLINSKKFDEVRPADSPLVAGEPWGGAFWDMRLAVGRAQLDRLLLSAWSELGAGGPTGLGRRFVDKIIDLASAAGPRQAEQIRAVLRDRHFAF